MLILLFVFMSSTDAVTLNGSSEYAVPGTEFTLTCDVPAEANLVQFYHRPDVTAPVGSIQVASDQCYNIKANPPVHCTPDVCSCVTSGGLGTVFRWIIQPQTGDHGSVWYCRRNNLNLPNGSQTLDSADYTLNVAAPGSSIALSPPDTTYTRTEGDTLPNITCTANCRPDCTFVWTRPDNTNFTLSPVLSLGQLDRSEHGTYKCTSRNLAGEFIISTSLTVQYGPGDTVVFDPLQDSVDINENQTISDVTCSADCRPPCTYTWSKGGTDYTNPLSLSVANRNNAGQYTCTARNTVNQRTKPWNLIVRFPPRILSLDYTDGGSDVAEHGPKSLVCSVESFPPSTIQWIYKVNNTLLQTNPDVLESTYTLNNADCLDTGLYTCSVRNSVSNTAVARDIPINVLCKPRQDPRFQLDYSFGLATADPLVINAMFLSNPQPNYTWYFHTSPGMDVISLVNGRDDFTIQNTFLMSNLSAVSVVRRIKIEASWFGVYNVTAKNNQGSKTLSFTVAAKGKPDPPYGGIARCPYEDQATLSWTSAFNGGSNQTFTVGMRTDTQSSIAINRNINQSDPGRGKTVTTTVTGLNAGTMNFFTVYAVNEFGNSSLVEEVNCTTQAKPPTGSSVIGPVIGGLCGAIVVLIVVAAVIIIKKRNSGKKSQGDDRDMVGIENRAVDDDSEGGMKANILYESAGLKPNVLYESSGPLPGSSSEYAVVDKPSKPSKKKPVSPDAVYAVVDKSNNGKSESAKDVYADVVKPKPKNGKEKKKQGKGKQKGGHGNAEKNNVYANVKEDDKNAAATGRQTNKEGLIYLDVVFKDGDKGTTGITHGIENRTDYADVDFSKQAPSLPPDTENEQSRQDGK